MQDRQAEATRLMEHVAASEKRMLGLKLDKAYFSNPDFSSVMAVRLLPAYRSLLFMTCNPIFFAILSPAIYRQNTMLAKIT